MTKHRSNPGEKPGHYCRRSRINLTTSFTVGFAAETRDVADYARQKLGKKRLGPDLRQ